MVMICLHSLPQSVNDTMAGAKWPAFASIFSSSPRRDAWLLSLPMDFLLGGVNASLESFGMPITPAGLLRRRDEVTKVDTRCGLYVRIKTLD